MSKFILPEIKVGTRTEKSAVTLINRGGLKFFGTKNTEGEVVFDSEVYLDPRTEYTTAKVTTTLTPSQVKDAQAELLELAKNV